MSTDVQTKAKTYDGVEFFMIFNGLSGAFLQLLTKAHYTSPNNPPRKPFDFYAAKALTACLESNGEEVRLRRHERTLHYSSVFGITYVSRSAQWEDTLEAHVKAVDTTPLPQDSDFIRNKKEYFLKEIDVLKGIEFMGRLPVYDIHFEMDAGTKELLLADDFDDPPAAVEQTGDSATDSAAPGQQQP